jgi:hypothetical protein
MSGTIHTEYIAPYERFEEAKEEDDDDEEEEEEVVVEEKRRSRRKAQNYKCLANICIFRDKFYCFMRKESQTIHIYNQHRAAI